VGDESWFDSRRTAAGWKATFYVNESPPLSALIVDRGVVGGSTSAEPALAAAQLFRSALVRAGVRVPGGAALGEADDPAHLLAAMWNDPEIRLELLASLPVAGRTGTLHDRMRGTAATGVVLAKTGTTENASALSGFVGDRYAFSILQNGRPVSWTWARVAQD